MKNLLTKSFFKQLTKLFPVSLLILLAFSPEAFAGADSFDADLDAELERLIPMVGKVVGLSIFLLGSVIAAITHSFKWLLTALGLSVVSMFGPSALTTLFSAII